MWIIVITIQYGLVYKCLGDFIQNRSPDIQTNSIKSFPFPLIWDLKSVIYYIFRGTTDSTENVSTFRVIQVNQPITSYLHIAIATPLIFIIAWIHTLELRHVWVKHVRHATFKRFSKTITRYAYIRNSAAKSFVFLLYFRSSVKSSKLT
jgi:hypothetical protein